VLVVIPYDDDDDAVRIANDSAYGLAGYVLSESLDRSVAVARRLRAGSIGLNGGAPYGADLPFGGFKASGIGARTASPGSSNTLVKSVAWPAG
jgi:aldehyde dehydrogenase (NAD+)